MVRFALHGTLAGCVGVTVLQCGIVPFLKSSPSEVCYLYISADGVRFVFRNSIPMKWLKIHAASFITLLFGYIMQKDAFFLLMRFLQQVKWTFSRQAYFLTSLRARRLLGHLSWLTIGSIEGMTVTDMATWQFFLAVCAHGEYHKFAILAMFAFPWCIIVPAVSITGKAKPRIERIVVGALVFKTVIVLPLARWIAALQRYRHLTVDTADARERLTNPDAIDEAWMKLSDSYYQATLVSVAAVGAWALLVTVLFVRDVRARN